MTLERQRIDKWLFYARFLKTRGAAARLVEGGKLRVNRQRIVKPAHAVVPGDVLTFVLHHRVRVIKVTAPGTRRGPPAEAHTLYEDLSPPEDQAPRPDPGLRPAGAGRPSKKARRQLDQMRDGGSQA